MASFSKWAVTQPPGPPEPPRPTEESYVVINSILRSKGRGIKYRRSPEMADKCPNKVATFGSVIKGVLHDENWVKTGPKLFLPMKINGLFVLLHHKGCAGSDVARQEVNCARVHWRLEVSGCKHPYYGPLICGAYVRAPDFHGRNAYRKADSRHGAVYFWEERGEKGRENNSRCENNGWWIAPYVGHTDDLGWAFNASLSSGVPGFYWEVPKGEEADPNLTIRMVETKCIRVGGHRDCSYDGRYVLEGTALNGHPWFKKQSPMRVLYCYDMGDPDSRTWRLDNRDQHGSLDFAAGGTHPGGLIPFGRSTWSSPDGDLILTWDCEAQDDNKQSVGDDDEDPWRMLEPWEVWYSERWGRPAFYNTTTGAKVWSLQATGCNSKVRKTLEGLEPRYKGMTDLLRADELVRKAPAQLKADPPTLPGKSYEVLAWGPVKVRKNPHENSQIYTYVEAGEVMQLYDWDETTTWRRCWFKAGLNQEAGCWAWVRFFNESGMTLFKSCKSSNAKDLKQDPRRGTLKGPLAIAVREGDSALVQQLLSENSCMFEIEFLHGTAVHRQMYLDTLLADAARLELSDICVNLLHASAEIQGLVKMDSTPTTELIKALTGEVFDLRSLDKALGELPDGTRDLAEQIMDQIAEKQCQMRREEEVRIQQKKRAAKQKAILGRQRATRDRLEGLERLQRQHALSEDERDEWNTVQGYADAEHGRLWGTLPPEGGTNPGADTSPQKRSARQKMLEKRERRMHEASLHQVPGAAAPSPRAQALEELQREHERRLAVLAEADGTAEQLQREIDEFETCTARLTQNYANTATEAASKHEDEEARREDEQLLREHEERMARLWNEGKLSQTQLQREERALEIKRQEARQERRRKAEEAKAKAQAEHDATEEKNRAAIDRELAQSAEKWTCGECNFDNPASTTTCIFCDTPRGVGPAGWR